ncbi:Glutamyl-Q tRNA(Asp) synthetase [Streptomyces microflavus]
MDLYKDVAEKLLAAGYAYPCYCTTEELDTRRDAARAAGKPSGYNGHCRDLTAEQKAAYEAEGRSSIVRFRMPDEAITFTDLVRGDITVRRRTSRTTASSAPTGPRSTRWSTRSTTR